MLTLNQYKLRRRYLPGLDGIRAIAVIAVIIFHLNKCWLKAGFLGVDTFFVISGYLITSLLILEFEEKGYIDLKAFWLRRIKRLIPALLFLLSIVLVYVVIFKAELLVDFKTDMLAALFYVSNWWYIIKDVDYFDLFQTSPLTHLWSLAIEEQFYLVFPILFIILVSRFNKTKIVKFLFFISLASLGLMSLIYSTTGDYSRAYFGTDTRFQTLLLGCIMAFVWNPFSVKENFLKLGKKEIDFLGFLSLLLLVLFMIFNSEASHWLYYGGFYFISLVTLITIVSSVEAEGLFSKVMGHPILVYIGRRSYSLYIWHYPIIEFVHSYFVQGMLPNYVYLIDLALMLIFTELSYRFIEVPVRRYGLKAFSVNYHYTKQFSRVVILSVFLVTSLTVYSGVIKAGKMDTPLEMPNQYQVNDKQSDADKKAEQARKQEEKAAAKKAQAKSKEEKEINAMDISHIKPLIIGDSVTVGAGEILNENVPNAAIDGAIGRQLIDATAMMRGYYADYAHEGQTIIFELGTNGDFYQVQLDELIESTQGADVYLVNTRVPREYENSVNKKIKQAEKKYDNVTIINWHQSSENHPEYFANDGIHLEEIGAEKLSELIVYEIKKHEWKRDKE